MQNVELEKHFITTPSGRTQCIHCGTMFTPGGGLGKLSHLATRNCRKAQLLELETDALVKHRQMKFTVTGGTQ